MSISLQSQTLENHISLHQATLSQTIREQWPILLEMAEEIVQSLLAMVPVLLCGNGECASAASRLACALLNRFGQERPALPAICLHGDVATLTGISNDYHFSEVFSRQIRALGGGNHVLFLMSANSNAINLLQAIKAAHDRKMLVLAFLGQGDQVIADYLRERDLAITVPSSDSMIVQEIHLVLIHGLCQLIDFRIFGHAPSLGDPPIS